MLLSYILIFINPFLSSFFALGSSGFNTFFPALFSVGVVPVCCACARARAQP